MKWGLGALLSGTVGWYFSNDMLQGLGLVSLDSNGKWQIVAVQWHIIGAMWPVWIIIALSGSLCFTLWIWLLSNNEKTLAQEYEEKLKEVLNNTSKEDKKLLDEVLYLTQHKNNLTKEINVLRVDKEKLVSKINHQHSTIQRLHTKINNFRK